MICSKEIKDYYTIYYRWDGKPIQISEINGHYSIEPNTSTKAYGELISPQEFENKLREAKNYLEIN